MEFLFGICIGLGFVIFFPNSFEKLKKKIIDLCKNVTDKKE